jgi:hypothetical protein
VSESKVARDANGLAAVAREGDQLDRKLTMTIIM